MGDRCYLSINWRKSDTTRVMEVLGKEFGLGPRGTENLEGLFDEIINSGTMTNGICSEANYGWYEQLQALAKAKVVFYGYHGEGGEYGSSVFVGWNGHYLDCNSDIEEEPVIRINDDGEPNAEELRHARRYILAVKKAKEHIDHHDKNPCRKQ